MYGYEAINRLLYETGVKTVFHFMAEDTMEMMADMVTDETAPVNVVHARHEQGAMAMADAYARASDRIGVCVVGRGPGIAQTGTALVNARKNGSKLLVIVPTPATTDRHDPKIFKQSMYLEATVQNVLTVNSESTLTANVSEAIRRVSHGEGPVVVQIPKDILKESVTDTASIESDSFSNDLQGSSSLGVSKLSITPKQPDDTAVDEAIQLYLDSDAYQPPVILIGEGAVKANARAPIETLAERLNAILVTSLKGLDYFQGHPFAVGFSGNWGSPLANEFLSQASFVLAIGCSLNNHTVDEGYLIDDDATVVHVDKNPETIGEYTSVDLGIVGDARLTVEALVEVVDQMGIDRERELWTSQLQERIETYSPLDEREFPNKEHALDPRVVTRTLEEVLPEDRLVCTDGGQFRKWSLHALSTPPKNSIISCDFAAIGLGLPMGVGLGQFLKDNHDERTAVAICGDGGFMMSLQELETAVRNEIPVIVIVGNDESLGSEYQYLDVQGGPSEVARMSTPSIASVADSLGAQSWLVDSVERFNDIADRLRDPEEPIVVECRIDHEVQHHSY